MSENHMDDSGRYHDPPGDTITFEEARAKLPGDTLCPGELDTFSWRAKDVALPDGNCLEDVHAWYQPPGYWDDGDPASVGIGLCMVWPGGSGESGSANVLIREGEHPASAAARWLQLMEPTKR